MAAHRGLPTRSPGSFTVSVPRAKPEARRVKTACACAACGTAVKRGRRAWEGGAGRGLRRPGGYWSCRARWGTGRGDGLACGAPAGVRSGWTGGCRRRHASAAGGGDGRGGNEGLGCGRLRRSLSKRRAGTRGARACATPPPLPGLKLVVRSAPLTESRRPPPKSEALRVCRVVASSLMSVRTSLRAPGRARSVSRAHGAVAWWGRGRPAHELLRSCCARAALAWFIVSRC